MNANAVKGNPKLDSYFSKAQKWQAELNKLRMIILDCGLTEEMKWGKPVYTFQEGNVLILWGFKDHSALGFCKGALLKDANGILSSIGENTQAARKVQFTDVQEIVELEPTLRAYIHEAIEAEKAGLEVTYKKTSEFSIPEEFQSKLDEVPALKTAFNALTPGRQRGYLLHFSAPKQSKTRQARVEKWTPQILNRKGLKDE